MIPNFIVIPGAPWPVLPPGIHNATIDEVRIRYATSPHRVHLYNGLIAGLDNIFGSGCVQIYLNGSFITAKPKPKDYEVAWDPRFVNPASLDSLFLEFWRGTVEQARKYGGEYFPSHIIEAKSAKKFIDFFQQEKHTGQPKGIIRIENYLKGGGVI
ncbi:MAG TPA: hypothetical protein VFR58_06520 [Flavisolibacter sp.]|nr:hypothetical protein [Flavisolibacter sp.]